MLVVCRPKCVRIDDAYVNQPIYQTMELSRALPSKQVHVVELSDVVYIMGLLEIVHKSLWSWEVRLLIVRAPTTSLSHNFR